jgi:hypothetical protein
MDITQLIGLVAPVALSLIVQGIKKLIGINGYVAIVVVFVIGGLGAVAGAGPVPDAGWIDTVVNSGWIIGVATFLYNVFKKKE